MLRKSTLVLSALLLVAAIGLSVLATVAIDLYRQYSLVRLDPLGMAKDNAAYAGSYDYFLLGDSLMAYWRLPGRPALNAGVAGQTSGQVLCRLRLMGSAFHAEKAIVCVGGNDLKALRFDAAKPDDLVDGAARNIREIVRLCKTVSNSTFILTVPPLYTVPFYLRPLRSTQVMLDTHAALNRAIAAIAQGEGIHLVDCQKVLESLDGRTALAADGVHLSAKAYELLLNTIDRD